MYKVVQCMAETVVLGLSGGVDSAVALHLLQQEGFQVHGVYLDIGLGGAEDARAVAARAEISFEVVSIAQPLEERVCAPFAAEYLAGETPLPCARCNRSVKFPALFAVADRIGAPWVATGHYACIRMVEGEACLAAAPSEKDQSYMLARLHKDWLKRLMFPLGRFQTKEDVREQAREFAIPVAEKADSMEICFIPNDDYVAWLHARGAAAPEGNFVLQDGTVLGKHRGIHAYTIGQGRGLGVSYRHRLFVTEIRPETNEVVLSDGSDLYKTVIYIRDYQALYTPTAALTAKFRHSKSRVCVTMRDANGLVRLETQSPVRAPVAGQLAVLYQDDIVVGSGWITNKED